MRSTYPLNRRVWSPDEKVIRVMSARVAEAAVTSLAVALGSRGLDERDEIGGMRWGNLDGRRETVRREEQGREHLAGQLLPLRLGQGQGLIFQRGDLRTVLSASVARNDSITPSVTIRKPKAGAQYV
jgi:hypothetical protein